MREPCAQGSLPRVAMWMRVPVMFHIIDSCSPHACSSQLSRILLFWLLGASASPARRVLGGCHVRSHCTDVSHTLRPTSPAPATPIVHYDHAGHSKTRAPELPTRSAATSFVSWQSRAAMTRARSWSQAPRTTIRARPHGC